MRRKREGLRLEAEQAAQHLASQLGHGWTEAECLALLTDGYRNIPPPAGVIFSDPKAWNSKTLYSWLSRHKPRLLSSGRPGVPMRMEQRIPVGEK